MNDRASRHGPSTVVRLTLLAVAGLCLGVQPCCMPVPCAVFLCFATLDGRGFLGPLIFLEIILEVFLSIETVTPDFSLRVKNSGRYS